MALIKCPDCNKEISSRAHMCPFCGCPAEFFWETNKTIEFENDSGLHEKEADSSAVHDGTKDDEIHSVEKDDVTVQKDEYESLSEVNDKLSTEDNNTEKNETEITGTIENTEQEETDEKTEEVGTGFVIIDQSVDISDISQERPDIETGKKQCPNCGDMINEIYRFCSSCGYDISPIAVSDNEDKIPCQGCGKMIVSTAQFCNFCGSSIGGNNKKASIYYPKPATMTSKARKPDKADKGWKRK